MGSMRGSIRFLPRFRQCFFVCRKAALVFHVPYGLMVINSVTEIRLVVLFFLVVDVWLFIVRGLKRVL